MNNLAITAHKRHQKILDLKNGANKVFVLLGKELKELKDNEEYKVLGYETFEAYLGMPELSFRRSTAYYLISIYEVFVLKLGYEMDRVAEADWGKLALILPIVSVQPIGHKDWFNKALALSRSDLQLEIKESKNGRTEPCLHENTQKIVICLNCHAKL